MPEPTADGPLGSEPGRSDEAEGISELEGQLASLSPPELLAAEYAALLPAECIALPWLRALVGQAFPGVAAEPEPGHPDPWQQVERRLLELRLLVPGADPHLVCMHGPVQGALAGRMAGEEREKRRQELVAHAKARGQFLWEGWVAQDNRWEIEPLRRYAEALLAAGEVRAGASVASWVQEPIGKLRRHAERRELLRLSLAAQEREFPASDPGLAATCSNLALVEQDLGNLEEARALLQRAVAILEKAHGPRHHSLAVGCINLATVERDLGNLREARALLKRAIAIDRRVFAFDDPALAAGHLDLAAVERDLGNLQEARALLRRAIAIWEKAYEPDHPTLALGYSNLAMVERDAGNRDEARRLLQRAHRISLARLGPEHPQTQNIADGLDVMGVAPEAAPEAERPRRPWWRPW